MEDTGESAATLARGVLRDEAGRTGGEGHVVAEALTPGLPVVPFLQFGVEVGGREIDEPHQGDVVVEDRAVVGHGVVAVQVDAPGVVRGGFAAIVGGRNADALLDELPVAVPLPEDGDGALHHLAVGVFPVRIVQVDEAVMRGRGLEPGAELVHLARQELAHALAGAFPGGIVVLHVQALAMTTALADDGFAASGAGGIVAGGPVFEILLEAGIEEQVPGLTPARFHQWQVGEALGPGGGGEDVQHVADAVTVDVLEAGILLPSRRLLCPGREPQPQPAGQEDDGQEENEGFSR